MELIIKKGAKDFAFMGMRPGDNLTLPMCGSTKLEEGNAGFSPMQVMLFGLGGCMSIDIMNILKKQRQTVDDYEVQMQGHRADATPAVYERVVMHVNISGNVKPEKLEQAIQLSKEKYCSVLHSMRSDIELEVTYTIDNK